MITVYKRNNREKCAVIGKEKNVVEANAGNDVDSLTFSVPGSAGGVSSLKPFNYVRWSKNDEAAEASPLYRIITPAGSTDDYEMLNYECEHVIATLIDDVLFGAFTIGGVDVYTQDVIRWLLSKQTTKNWVLGECDFHRQFEYGWENENLLTSLFSVPNRFTDPYLWVFDTSKYPWVVSLKMIDANGDPQFCVRAGKNLISSATESAAQDVCTRLYGLGYGEGINQLTIESVNNGIPYVEAPQAYIDEYGLISRIFVDRRFEDAQSLKDRMLAILSELKEPTYSRTVSVADLFELTEADFDKAEIGRIVLLADDETKTYITGIRRNRDEVGHMELTLSSKPTDIASSMADLADRQRIEAVYSQGATQIYAHSVQANATPDKGAIMKFYIPAEMRIINSVKAKVVLDRFRSYSQATANGGSSAQTSSSGGGGQNTSSSGGGAAATSESSSKATTNSGGSFNFNLFTSKATPLNRVLNQQNFEDHYHTASVIALDHSHGMPHTHTVNVPGHTHSVNTSAHTHNVSIPGHTHEIEQGIFEFGNASTAEVHVNGALKAVIDRDDELELTDLLLDANGNLPRGSWLEIEIKPNDLAYVCIDLFVQGFIQSRGESVY